MSEQKFCKDCEHYRKGLRYLFDHAHCNAVKEPVHGRPELPCLTRRALSSQCRPDASDFTPRLNVVHRWWVSVITWLAKRYL